MSPINVKDFDALILFRSDKKTVFVKDKVNDDEIFIIVINSKEPIKTITQAIREALNLVKEEYIRRWKQLRKQSLLILFLFLTISHMYC